MITSGMFPFDDRLGGLTTGRIYLLTGAPGTGKTTAALEFLDVGRNAGEKVFLITGDHASGAFAQLRSLIGAPRPTRVVVDPIEAFLVAGAERIDALAELLESSGATALVTYAADLAARPDRRLEPLLRRAAGVVHLTRADDEHYRLELRPPRFLGEIELPFVTQPRADDTRYELMDTHGFRNAVNAHMAGDRAPRFAVLTLQPHTGASRELADLVLRSLRCDGGDLAGSVDNSVTVYLHCAQRQDATPFAERIRNEWRRAGHGKLDVAIAAYPAEDAQVLSLLSPGSPRSPLRLKRT